VRSLHRPEPFAARARDRGHRHGYGTARVTSDSLRDDDDRRIESHEDADVIIALALAVAAFAAAADLPPASASASVAALPDCSASQLSITFDGESGNFSGMSQSGTLLVVRNIGATACRVPALPLLQFEDAEHHRLSIERQAPRGMHPGPIVVPVGIAAGAEATAILRWVSNDVYDGHHCVSPSTAIVQVDTSEYRQPFVGRFCSALNTPATFTQAWLKTDATLNSAKP
jgi:hypothetical protein